MPATLRIRRAAAQLDLRSAAGAGRRCRRRVFAQARALLHWQRAIASAASAAPLEFVRGGWLGALRRSAAIEHYPRTDPAIIVAVSDGERLLLGRQASWPARRWSVLAGFVEPGESLEQTVAREVMEEAGVRVRSCRYLASQPWPFPGALMLGFSADADPQPVVGAELEDARWFSGAAESARAGRRAASCSIVAAHVDFALADRRLAGPALTRRRPGRRHAPLPAAQDQRDLGLQSNHAA